MKTISSFSFIWHSSFPLRLIVVRKSDWSLQEFPVAVVDQTRMPGRLGELLVEGLGERRLHGVAFHEEIGTLSKDFIFAQFVMSSIESYICVDLINRKKHHCVVGRLNFDFMSFFVF